MSWLEVLAVIGIIGFVIYQQLAGQFNALALSWLDKWFP